ncbi:hypothetical protein SKAU_G00203010 [Synaphobranchus kaupii]|uniref:Uncharacterized protein n=1 Tax=Synaphobranchus kaupii TaxID=118154 RepID=A0A9Q1FFU7_SYNKA|nr:hypothetical protein SKAU_G00203010 [Synaphobranchus kaupii]
MSAVSKITAELMAEAVTAGAACAFRWGEMMSMQTSHLWTVWEKNISNRTQALSSQGKNNDGIRPRCRQALGRRYQVARVRLVSGRRRGDADRGWRGVMGTQPDQRGLSPALLMRSAGAAGAPPYRPPRSRRSARQLIHLRAAPGPPSGRLTALHPKRRSPNKGLTPTRRAADRMYCARRRRVPIGSLAPSYYRALLYFYNAERQQSSPSFICLKI